MHFISNLLNRKHYSVIHETLKNNSTDLVTNDIELSDIELYGIDPFESKTLKSYIKATLDMYFSNVLVFSIRQYNELIDYRISCNRDIISREISKLKNSLILGLIDQEDNNHNKIIQHVKEENEILYLRKIYKDDFV